MRSDCRVDDPIAAADTFARFLRDAVHVPEFLATDHLSDFLGSLKGRVAACGGAPIVPRSSPDEQLDDDSTDENPQGTAVVLRAFASAEYMPTATPVGSPVKGEAPLTALLRVALMPYVADVVFPTEAVLGLADSLAAGLVSHAYGAVRDLPRAVHSHTHADALVSGFSFLPGYAGVTPTPPCSPCACPSPVDGDPSTPPHSRACSPCREPNPSPAAPATDDALYACGFRAPASSPVSGSPRPHAHDLSDAVKAGVVLALGTAAALPLYHVHLAALSYHHESTL